MKTVLILLLTGLGVARAEEGVHLPASTTTVRTGSAVKVVYPFGAVTVPRSAVAAAPADAPMEKGPLQAQTRGRFHLSYSLEQRGDRVVARRVRMRVANRETYHAAPTERLREHEAIHVRINEREARRIEKVLRGFTTAGSLDAAEKKLKARFNAEVEGVRRLHADWDENHVFPLDPPAEETE